MSDFLTQYRPDISVLDQFSVDPSDPDYAWLLWKKLLEAKQGHQILFLVIGKLLKEVKEKKVYQTLNYETFEQFLASEELCWSRESAYMFMRVYEYYIEKLGMTEERVSSITLTKLSMMIPMTKELDKEQAIEKIEELSTLRHNDFMIRSKQSKLDDKPTVWYSKELELWMVQYYSDRTKLIDHGIYEEFKKL